MIDTQELTEQFTISGLLVRRLHHWQRGITKKQKKRANYHAIQGDGLRDASQSSAGDERTVAKSQGSLPPLKLIVGDKIFIGK